MPEIIVVLLLALLLALVSHWNVQQANVPMRVLLL
jgi:hypothetical protein